MISDIELDAALAKARVKHPHLCSDMGRQILEAIETSLADDRNNKVTRPFGEHIRMSLNLHNIRDNRTAYSSLAGSFFGLRGNKKARFGNSRSALHPKGQAFETKIEPDGQFALII